MGTDLPVQEVIFEVILPLSSADATLARAGGKGANLAALTRAGFQVPPGFIVTTDAYRAFVNANRIESRLLELAGAVSPDDPTALDSTSQAIRALFTEGTLQAGIAESIRDAYEGLSPTSLGHPAVAVRSSATTEDLPGLSFAGQHETYLNIVGPDALIEAVKSCWGSLWTARAMGYRAHNNIAQNDVALAVVVQVMIPSEVSGVLFTANPLTGHRDQTVIDASFGLGEALVSGQVEPDHYVVNQREMRISFRKLGAKTLAILPRREGGTESVSDDRRHEQALPDARIIDLARIAGRVADHFGSPQDIEWAWAGGRLYLLQSRLITSLYPLPESLLHSGDLRVLFSVNSVQGVVEPFTPLGRDILPLLFTGILRTAGVRRAIRDIVIAAGGRLFVDVTVPVSDRRLRRVLLALLAKVDPGARETVLGLMASGRIRTSAVGGLRNILRLMVGLRSVIARMVMTWVRPEAMRKSAMKKAEQFVTQVRQAISSAASIEARLAVIDRYAPNILLKVIFRTIAPVMAPGLLAMGMVDHLLTAWAGAEPGTVLRLLRGLRGNTTTEMDLKLWAAAQAIRSDLTAKALFLSQPADTIARAYKVGQLPAAAQGAIKAFLDEYGMRAIGEIDVGRPRWREDPRSIIQNLSSYLQIDDPDLAPDRMFQRAGAEAEKLSAEYITRVRRKKGGLRALLLGAAIRRMRMLGGLREVPKFYIIKLLDLFRTALLDSGRELVAQRKLDFAEDIFYISLDTLRAMVKGESADPKAIVDRERADYNDELARRQVPRVLLSTGEVFYQGISGTRTGDLVGDGVSPGTVEGRVRVVLDPRGVRLQPGEILVCPATDPGWTPLFLSAGGLVMELGGMMTHGSVVAREYGIPAVVGVDKATKRLRTGQVVRVDGSAGRVVVLDHEPV